MLLGGSTHMTSRTIAARSAVVGTITALATAGLVAGTAGTATADPVTTTYTCTQALIGAFEVPVLVEPPALPTVPAGVPVPAGALPVEAVAGVPAAVAGMLGLINADGGALTGFSVLAGGTAIPIQGLAGTGEKQADGSLLMRTTGTNGAFTSPLPGTHDLSMPTSFNLVPTSAGTLLNFEIPCSTEAPASLGQLTTVKQGSQMSAKKVTKVKRGTKAKLPVSVTNMVGGASGDVVAQIGKKKVTKALSDGQARLALPRLKKPGTYKVKLSYLGDTVTEAAKKTVKIKVTT